MPESPGKLKNKTKQQPGFLSPIAETDSLILERTQGMNFGKFLGRYLKHSRVRATGLVIANPLPPPHMRSLRF